MLNRLATVLRRTMPDTPGASPDLRGEQTSQPRCDTPAYLRYALVCACIAAILATPFFNFKQASAHTQATIPADCSQAGAVHFYYTSQIDDKPRQRCYANDGTNIINTDVALSNIYQVQTGNQDAWIIDNYQSTITSASVRKRIHLQASQKFNVFEVLGTYSMEVTNLEIPSGFGNGNDPLPPGQPSIQPVDCSKGSDLFTVYSHNDAQTQCFTGTGTWQLTTPIDNVDAVYTGNHTGVISYNVPETSPGLTYDISLHMNANVPFKYTAIPQLVGLSTMTVDEITLS